MAHRKSGFTLIEMLVVIGLISVLAMGISMLNMKDASQAIYSAQRSMMTAFYEARTTALTRQTDVKVIIYKGSDISRKLRQVGVIYKVKGEDGLDLGWVALNDGFRMPEGVFFVPSASNFSSFVKTSGQTSPSEIFKSTFNNGYTGAYEIVGVPEFPSRQPIAISDGNGDWFSYQFSSDGLSLNPGALVMLAMGHLDGEDYYVIDNPYNQLGFAIRRIGITIPFSDYSEMEETLR